MNNLLYRAVFMVLSVGALPALSIEYRTHEEYSVKARELLAKRSDPAYWFISADGKPTSRLVTLLQIDGLYDENDTLQKIVDKTQRAWIQTNQGQGNKERTDLQDSIDQQNKRAQIEKIVDELGLFNERPPALDHYDYGACLGAFLDGVRRRLKELIELWEAGTRFDTLVFFTGERYLRKDTGKEDDLEKLVNPKHSPLTIKAGWKMPEDASYNTEYDMCKLVWDQTEIPEDMRKALEGRVVFVNAPAPPGKPRPSTKDGYKTWISENKPKPGTILAPSHPLIWTYQHIAGENALGKDYMLDTTAKAATAEERKNQQERIVSLVQDTIAKCLYELNERQKLAGVSS